MNEIFTQAGGGVSWRIRGSIADVVLDTEPLHVINVETVRALGQVYALCVNNNAIRAITIRGGGERAFSAGSDIREFPRFLNEGSVIEQKLYRENEVYTQIATCPLFTMAIVDGLCLGGGLELAACADYIIATPTSEFALPEIKLGVFPGSGGLFRIPQRIGVPRTKWLSFTGNTIDAGTALQWGLIDALAERGELSQTADLLINQVICHAPGSIRAIKELVGLESERNERAGRLALLRQIDMLFSSADAQRGVHDFINRRNRRVE